MLPIGDGVRVIHTPGHTPGSLCFMDEGRRLLFSGDTLFSDGDRVSRSVPFPGYDGDAYRHSINMLANEDFDTLCGGHGRPLVGGATHATARSLPQDQPGPRRRGVCSSRACRGASGEDGRRRGSSSRRETSGCVGSLA